MLVATVFTAYAQQQDGWNKEFSSMNFDTLYISDSAGAAQGNYFVRTKFLGNVSSQVIWGKGGFDIPFNGELLYYIRNNETPEVVPQVKIILCHKDTTIFSGLANISDSLWHHINYLWQDWSGRISKFDSIAIVEQYHPWSSEFVQQTVDFDAFHSKLNGQWVMFYDGGEMGKVEGVAFYDVNQNGLKDVDEFPLSGWKMYLVDTTMDSTIAITNTDGYYLFPAVPRGTYTLSCETRSGWTPTTPAESTLVISNDLYHLVNFGQYSDQVELYRVEKGWNMVSLPWQVADASVKSVFPGASSRLFEYNGAYYQVAETLKANKGYWLKFPQADTVLIAVPSFLMVLLRWWRVGT